MKPSSAWTVVLLAVAGLLAATVLGAAAYFVAGEDSAGLSPGSIAAGEPLAPITTADAGAAPAAPRDRGRATEPGEALFIASCGGCHALGRAGTTGGVGPDLGALRPEFGDVVEQVTEGGGGMPGFGGLLSRAQIETLAAYVSGARGRAASPGTVTAPGATTRSAPAAPPRTSTPGTPRTAAPRTSTQTTPRTAAPRTSTQARPRTTPPPTTTRSTPAAPPTVTEVEDDDSGKGRGRGRGGDDDRDDDDWDDDRDD